MLDNPKVVCLGGGHGLAATLAAMRTLTRAVTAVVTVADNGGSSGRLRDEFNSLPPGDLRMALAALCADDEWGKSWAQIMQYRFTSEGHMNNHAVGNLLLTALWDKDQDPVKGLDRVGDLLKVVGRVLPMALDPLDIEATFITMEGEKIIRGQVEVAAAIGKVSNLRLIPTKPKATPEAIEAILDADWITIGPGSWISSVMPHFLFADQAAAIVASKAKKIMIFNLPDKETFDEYSGFSLEAHLKLVLDHIPGLKIDFALIDKSLDNKDSIFASMISDCGGVVVSFDLADHSQNFHHDRDKLSLAFSHIFQ